MPMELVYNVLAHELPKKDMLGFIWFVTTLLKSNIYQTKILVEGGTTIRFGFLSASLLFYRREELCILIGDCFERNKTDDLNF